MLFLFGFFVLCGCSNSTSLDNNKGSNVFYEIFVRAFADSDGDGIGDFNGITENLDYLESLGIEGIWLLPVYPSPSYHGYDITDYYDVNSDYGSLEDFKNLVDEAHKRDIKVILDMVLNHASSEHPWFVESKEDSNSSYSDYFIWANENDNTYDFNATPIDGKAWSKFNDRYYYGAFWHGMPDWNASNPKVREEFINIGQYWIDLGVDGFRLDAAKYMYAEGEYNLELNLLEENLDFWNEVITGWKDSKEDLHIVSEVWSSSSSVAPYFSSLDSNFNFDLADSIVSVVKRERDLSGFGLMKNLKRMYENFSKYSDDFNDAVFLTNHDQDRVMSVLNGDLDRMKLAADIYLLLPGTPYIYYGEELGMMGRKPDEDIRLPFKWGNEYETSWRTDTYNTDLESVLEQKENDNSLLNHYRKLIDLRSKYVSLREGDFVPVKFNKNFVIGNVRYTEDEAILVLHNVSEKDCEILVEVQEEDVVFSTNSSYTLEDKSVIIPSKGTILLKVPVESISLYEELEVVIG